jgi:hypothetical protein
MNIFNGTSFGEMTPVDGINLIDNRVILQLSPEFRKIPKPETTGGYSAVLSFNEMVSDMSNRLEDYFNIIKDNFNGDVCTALTGGNDTRLLLALMRRTGIHPKYLYVYNEIRQPTCVSKAQAIAEGEGLRLELVDYKKYPKYSLEDYPEFLRNRYYIEDGLAHENGIFSEPAGFNHRLQRAGIARMQLNGGLGEIFRNFWLLPNRSMTAKSFVQSRYDIDFSACTNRFNRISYLDTLVKKSKFALGTANDLLSHRQIVSLFPFWFGRYWTSTNNSINNQLSYALTPFGDGCFVSLSLDIPFKYKKFSDYSVFTAAMIKYLDPKLAKYDSHYGYNFYDGMHLSGKIGQYAKLYTPVWLRGYIRKRLWQADRKKLTLTKKKPTMPYYLTKEFQNEIFKMNDFYISKYIDLDKIENWKILSRVLSAELIIRDAF